MQSLPPRGAWIEMIVFSTSVRIALMSLPPRGAWIEINECHLHLHNKESLPPRGAWIEITMYNNIHIILDSRSPHGERGLKCPGGDLNYQR